MNSTKSQGIQQQFSNLYDHWPCEILSHGQKLKFTISKRRISLGMCNNTFKNAFRLILNFFAVNTSRILNMRLLYCKGNCAWNECLTTMELHGTFRRPLSVRRISCVVRNHKSRDSNRYLKNSYHATFFCRLLNLVLYKLKLHPNLLLFYANKTQNFKL